MSQILDAVDRHARERPDALAAVEIGPDRTRRELTWGELDLAADRAATRLLELGVVPGEPVAYQLPNRLEFLTLTLAILRIGAVCEPLMPIFREHELEFMLREAAVRVLIVPERFRGHGYRAMATGLRERLPGLQHVLVLDGPEQPFDVSPDANALAARRPGAAAVAQLLFTSGSTGEPKGVLQRQDVLSLAAEAHIRHFALTPADVIYIPSPLAHQTGFLYGLWIAWLLGATQVIQTIWDAEVGFEAMRSTGVSFVQAATPFLADLVRVADELDQTLPELRVFVATGAAIPRELAREARAKLGAEVGGAFGTTESCLGAAFAPGDPPERAWGSDGRALEGITLRVVDDAGNPLPPNAEGNFEIFTPTLFEGYLNRPELTAAALTPDGYYRTGDLARIDEHGYLRITGRVKDVINRGGEKVPVAEVEQLLYTHPAVREIAIVAMPDPRLGERACAFVVPEPGATLEFVEMQRHLDDNRLAKPYWPERLELVESLPHTPSGKIQKYLLRARLAGSEERKAVFP
ncbi:MAG TPA: AMP-binding protein [Solirubrobacteraceae bacterium]|nr:AMP-binding protein [Solirubrobacteraceae bacterium]